jgi:hypothetical protein
MLKVAKELETSRLAREEAHAEEEAEAYREQQAGSVVIVPPYAGYTAGYPVISPYVAGFYHKPFFPTSSSSSFRTIRVSGCSSAEALCLE